MNYLSLFSGIEAASVAWHSLGWKAAGFSEIEPFPCAVLAERWPGVTNFGDITEFEGWPDACICDSGEYDRPGVDRRVQRKGVVGRRRKLHAGGDGSARGGDNPGHGGNETNGTTKSICGTCNGLRIDLVVGGSPCQSFSIAGLRKGLSDPRGNLMLTFGGVVRKYLPDWVIWENVPGVLSSHGGRDFATFLGLLTGQIVKPPRDGWNNAGILEGYGGAYGVAWRVLDTQYTRIREFPRAVPQRRRRVFVVGYIGDGRRAAAVLFDAESVSGNPAPRRKAVQGVAGTVENGSGSRGYPDPSDGNGGGLVAAKSHWSGGAHPTLSQSNNSGGIGMSNQELFAQGGAGLVAARMTAIGEYVIDDTASTLKQRDYKDATDLIATVSGEDVAHTLKGEGFDGSEDGTGRGVPVIAVESGQGYWMESETSGTIHTRSHKPCAAIIAFSCKDSGQDANEDVSPTLRSMNNTEGNANAGGQVAVVYENHPQDSRIREMGDVCTSVNAKYGTGGENVPLVSHLQDPCVRADEPLTLTGFASIICHYGTKTKTDAGQILSFLQRATVSKKDAERLIGKLAAFQSSQVLRPDLYGGRVSGTVQGSTDSGTGEISGADADEAPEMRILRHDRETAGHTPYRRKSAEQRTEQSTGVVPVVPYAASSPESCLHNLWATPEGTRILQSALDAVLEVWRSADDQDPTTQKLSGLWRSCECAGTVRKALYASETSGDSISMKEGERGVSLRTAIAGCRLTPL